MYRTGVCQSCARASLLAVLLLCGVPEGTAGRHHVVAPEAHQKHATSPLVSSRSKKVEAGTKRINGLGEAYVERDVDPNSPVDAMDESIEMLTLPVDMNEKFMSPANSGQTSDNAGFTTMRPHADNNETLKQYNIRDTVLWEMVAIFSNPPREWIKACNNDTYRTLLRNERFEMAKDMLPDELTENLVAEDLDDELEEVNLQNQQLKSEMARSAKGQGQQSNSANATIIALQAELAQKTIEQEELVKKVDYGKRLMNTLVVKMSKQKGAGGEAIADIAAAIKTDPVDSIPAASDPAASDPADPAALADPAASDPAALTEMPAPDE